MNRYAIELAYNGTSYHGWQKQKNAKSVQGELDEKLSILLREPIETLGCGRTDAGVHAKHFVAHFDHSGIIDCETISYKINKLLPKNIVCSKIWLTKPDFNARFDANWRTYEYIITTKPNPFMNDLAWLYRVPLDVEKMNIAAQYLLQFDDFECFSKTHTQVNNYKCTLVEAYWRQEGDLLIFKIKANRFLRNMVRAIVGTLIEVGLGSIGIEDLKRIIESKNRSMAGMSVPAHGLFLTQVTY
jgi:tRNA pseudouridine38-40 synthase